MMSKLFQKFKTQIKLNKPKQVPVSQLMTPIVCEGAVLPRVCWTAALEGMPQYLSGMPSAR